MPADLQTLLYPVFPDLPPGGFPIRPVGGDSINETFKISTIDNAPQFCKFNDSTKYPALFGTEARGLDLLARAGIFRIPLTITCTTWDERQVLVHLQTSPDEPAPRLFGLDHDNYMGALPQDNTPETSRPGFFIHLNLFGQRPSSEPHPGSSSVIPFAALGYLPNILHTIQGF